METDKLNLSKTDLLEFEIIKLGTAKIDIHIFSLEDEEEEICFNKENGFFILTSQRVFWYNDNYKIFFFYENTSTHGIQKNSLVCHLNNYSNKIIDSEELIIEKLNKKEINDINLCGNFKILFNFTKNSEYNIKEIFEKFAKCSAEIPNIDLICDNDLDLDDFTFGNYLNDCEDNENYIDDENDINDENEIKVENKKIDENQMDME